ncbi:MAG: hypothetical protein AAGC96_09030, partial [Pseudomonadota bacterium]
RHPQTMISQGSEAFCVVKVICPSSSVAATEKRHAGTRRGFGSKLRTAGRRSQNIIFEHSINFLDGFSVLY